MADPLSIAASILAILGASGKTLEGLEKVWELRHRDHEFKSFINQIAGVRTQLRAVRLSLESLVDSSLDIEPLQEYLGEIDCLCRKASSVFVELDQTIQYLLRKNAKAGNDNKPSKITWLRRKSTLNRLTPQITVLANSLAASLNMLQSLRIAVVSEHSLNILLSNTTLQSNALDKATTESMIETNLATSGALSRRSSIQSFYSAHSSISSSDWVAITGDLIADYDASLSEHCAGTCSCQCHTTNLMKMPQWAKWLLGSAVWHTNGAIILGRQHCNRKSCSQKNDASLQFTYLSPSWMTLKTLAFHIKYRRTSGLYSDFSFRMPRVIPGTSIIFSAIELGKLSTVKSMLCNGEASTYDVTVRGMSALHYAALQGQADIYSYLLSQGADPTFQDESGTAACQPGIDRSLSRTGLDRNVTSVDEKDFERLFVNNKAIDQQEFTLLHRIILELSDMKLETYLEVTTDHLNATDVNGRTPLLWAAWRGDARSLRYLLRSGANINKPDYEGFTPLSKAAKAGHLDCVRILLKNGATQTSCTTWGAQPIHLASENRGNSADIIQELLVAGADPSAESSFGTPLHGAANRGSLENVECLISHGADIDVLDSDGDTPASVALLCWNEPVFCYLCEKGAKLDTTRVSGENIVHLATWCSSTNTWAMITNAAKDGRLAGINIHATHDGHDIWKCFHECRNMWYPQQRNTDEELIQFRIMLDALGANDLS